MEKEKFTIGEAFSFGFDAVAKKFGFFILVLLVPALVQGLTMANEALRHSMGEINYWVVYVLLNILGLIVSLGVTIIVVKVAKGEKANLSDILPSDQRVITFLFTSIVYGLMILAGFLLLVIPGIYWAIKYSLFSYAIADKHVGYRDAFKISGDITKGYRWQLFLFGLATLVLNIAGALVLGVGLFFTLPVTYVAEAYIYTKLVKGYGIKKAVEEIAAPVEA